MASCSAGVEPTGCARRVPNLRAEQALEQPGCLHANMDLYKWAGKLAPFTPGDLLLDCFELARDIRELDMRASPYDLSGLGHAPLEQDVRRRAEEAGFERVVPRSRMAREAPALVESLL